MKQVSSRNIVALCLPFIALSIHQLFAAMTFPMPWVFLYPAIFYASLIGDFWVGVTNTVLTTLTLWYFVLPPARSFSSISTRHGTVLLVFIVMSLTFAEINRRLRRANEHNGRMLKSLREVHRQLIERERGLARTVEECKALEAQLEGAKECAEKANSAKSTFLANMSHEIRTPLGIIMGYADMIVTDGTEAEREEYAKRIRRSARNLLDLTNDILDLSKVESGKLSVEKHRFSPKVFFTDLMDELRVSTERKNLTLEFAVEGPLPETIETDTGRLRQIILNLVGNAVKFTEVGGVKVAVKTLRRGPRLQLEVRITDSGIGIAADQRNRLFRPFSQVQNSPRRYGGTGLGLSLSRKLARALGGDCQLESSEPQRGSVFLATIDAGEAVAILKVTDLKAAAREKGHKHLEGVHVLLVDDSEDNRLMFRAMLSNQGADVELAEDGAEGVEKALAQDFDVVLMDVQMPVVNGYEAARNLRQCGYTRPVVALTAEAMKGEAERCLAAGFSNYLAKPVTADDLSDVVYRCAKG